MYICYIISYLINILNNKKNEFALIKKNRLAHLNQRDITAHFVVSFSTIKSLGILTNSCFQLEFIVYICYSKFVLSVNCYNFWSISKFVKKCPLYVFTGN